MRNYRERTIVGHKVGLIGQIFDEDEELLTSVSGADVTILRDFDDFGEYTPAVAAAVSLVSPPAGTEANPDPRWSPGLDGKDGFNVQVDVIFNEIGRYKVALTIGTSIRIWWVSVGSGVS